ncbi:MAG: organic solvent tolerance ABC transporter substrate-binding protein [Nitrospinae bacterium]|nr:organic solvent tolerance ABC transporter substrate-binding protein [Nitrospinota bacterium]
MKSFSLISILISTLFVFSIPNVVFSGEPKNQIRGSINNLKFVLDNQSLKGTDNSSERRKQLRMIFEKRFDFNEMAKRALSRAWRKRTKKEKKEFLYSFKYLLESTYIGKIERYNGQTVQFMKESIDGNYAKVKTLVITKEQPIRVYYKMHKKKRDWLVYDVIIEGVSLIKTYRDQFKSILNRSSFSDLLDKMRAKQFEN